jgi:hypothetical protein
MLRAGASLPEIGQLLRHRRIHPVKTADRCRAVTRCYFPP